MRTLIKFQPKAFLFLSFFWLFSTLAVAQGDLLIYPKRLVFEGTKNRSETINLSNTGQDTAIYDISFVQIRMKEDGAFENITEPDPGQQFASPYLRYFPRRVVLAPNESQVVKVQLTRTNELEPGEYRSHIYFRSVPAVKPLGEELKEEPDPTSVSIRLTPIYGITIPCIIRFGESTTEVSISNVSVTEANGTPVLSMDINRTGNMSTYGNIIATHTSPQGKKTVVGEVKGYAVYTPGNRRQARIELKKPEGVDYRSGRLEVVYTSRDKGTKNYAKAELVL